MSTDKYIKYNKDIKEILLKTHNEITKLNEKFFSENFEEFDYLDFINNIQDEDKAKGKYIYKDRKLPFVHIVDTDEVIK